MRGEGQLDILLQIAGADADFAQFRAVCGTEAYVGCALFYLHLVSRLGGSQVRRQYVALVHCEGDHGAVSGRQSFGVEQGDEQLRLGEAVGHQWLREDLQLYAGRGVGAIDADLVNDRLVGTGVERLEAHYVFARPQAEAVEDEVDAPLLRVHAALAYAAFGHFLAVDIELGLGGQEAGGGDAELVAGDKGLALLGAEDSGAELVKLEQLAGLLFEQGRGRVLVGGLLAAHLHEQASGSGLELDLVIAAGTLAQAQLHFGALLLLVQMALQ